VGGGEQQSGVGGMGGSEGGRVGWGGRRAEIREGRVGGLMVGPMDGYENLA
jgi:hypothetical protein